MSNFVWVRNTVTGKIVSAPEHYLDHPVLGKNFVPADRKDKDYLPELYVAKDADEFTATKKSRKKEPEVPEEIVFEEPEWGVAE